MVLLLPEQGEWISVQACKLMHFYCIICLDILSARSLVRKYSSEGHSSPGLLRKAWNWINYDYSQEVRIMSMAHASYTL